MRLSWALSPRFHTSCLQEQLEVASGLLRLDSLFPPYLLHVQPILAFLFNRSNNIAKRIQIRNLFIIYVKVKGKVVHMLN
jgi:hypothetical protein